MSISLKRLLKTYTALVICSFSILGSDFVVSSGDADAGVSMLGGNPIKLLAEAKGISDAKFAFYNNSGSRLFLLSGNGTVVSLDSTNGFRQVSKYSFGSNITNAVLSNDGTKIFVLSGELKIIDTTVDETKAPFVSVGILPNSLASSLDSRTVFVTSARTRTLYAVDVQKRSVIAQQLLPMSPYGVTVGENGLIYVAGMGNLYEFDFNKEFIEPTSRRFIFEGAGGVPHITPDGQRVLMLDDEEVGANGVIEVNLVNGQFSKVIAPSGIKLSHLSITSNREAFTLGNGVIYKIGIGPLNSPTLALFGVGNGLNSLSASQERPESKSLLVTNMVSAKNVDLSSAVTTSIPISAANHSVNVFIPSRSAVNLLENISLPIPIGRQAFSRPIVVRATDQNGIPVIGATIEFSTSSPGVVLSSRTVITNAKGVAMVRAELPDSNIVKQYSVVASTGNINQQIDIAFNPTSDTGSRVSVISGSGQIINGGSTSQPIQVKVMGSNGSPESGISVNWSINSGTGVSISAPSSTTNQDGIATIHINTVSFSPTSTNYVRPFEVKGIVDTGTFKGNVSIRGVVHPSTSPLPQVSIKNNVTTTDGILILPSGTTIPNAFSASISSQDPISLRKPISNVGLRVYPQSGSLVTASCVNQAISNAQGDASCDLVVGSERGVGVLNVIVGELSNFIYTYQVRVISGVPSQLKIIQGDGQSGEPDSSLTKALVVEARDSLNNTLGGAAITWKVLSGDASLVNSRLVTNSEGLASSLVKFGKVPGPVEVRATTANLSVTFKLSIKGTSPQIESILNGASFVDGPVASCSVAVIRGSAFKAGLDGVIPGNPGENGSLPYVLEGVSAKINDIDVPLFYISDIEGVSQIGIQVPCGIAAGEAKLKVSAQGTETSKAINIKDIAPGIFETSFIEGQYQGVVVRSDGSYVNPQNPAKHGEILTGFFTGLMPTSDARTTNKPGEGQIADTSRIVIGLNHHGMPVISAKYAPGLIGVYLVEFQVNPDAGSGEAQGYSIGVIDREGSITYGNSTFLPIRAN